MSGTSLTAVLTGTAPAGATGTLSAKPRAMSGNALPFRLQLEASTAPLTPLGTTPVLQRDTRFVMPGCKGEGFDPFDGDADGLPARADPSSTDEDKDEGDAPLPTSPLIFDIPHYALPAIGHAGLPAVLPEPGSANLDVSHPVPVQAFATDSGRLPQLDNASSPASAAPALRNATTEAAFITAPITPSAEARMLPGNIETAAVGTGPAQPAAQRRGASAATSDGLPAPTAVLPGSAPSRPQIASNAELPRTDASPSTTPPTQALYVRNDRVQLPPAAQESASSLSDQPRAAQPLAANVSAQAPTTGAVRIDRPAPQAPATSPAQGPPSPANAESPSQTAPLAVSSRDVAGSPAREPADGQPREPQQSVTPHRTAATTATAAPQHAPRAAASAGSAQSPTTPPAEPQAIPRAQSTNDTATTDGEALTRSQPGLPALDKPAIQRRAAGPATGRDLLVAANHPSTVDGDATPRPIASPLDTARPESGHAGQSSNGSAQTPVSTQPVQAPTPDAAPSPIQNFDATLAHQIQPQANQAAGPALFTPSTPIPFDRQFGQRVGSAIGAAMNAMTVKDGMLLLKIAPERLGKIEIAIDRGSDRMQITTENEAVRGAIAQAHGRIEHELRGLGQRIGSIEVETRDASANGSASQSQTGAQQQRGQENAAQQSQQARPDARARSNDAADQRIPARPAPAGRAPSNIFYA